MNRCLQEIDILEWMIKRKDHPDPERTSLRNCPKELYIHNVSMNEVENTRYYRGNLLLVNKPRNRKDAAKEAEEQKSYYILINLSSRITRRYEHI